MMKQAPKTFANDSSAASAVEFALVAPLLLAIIFACFELGWYMTQRVLLEHGLDSATRAVQIGNSSVRDHLAFKEKVCDEAGPFLRDCRTDLLIEMIPLSSATGIPSDDAVCVDRSQPINPVVRFNPGAPTNIIYLRACLLVQTVVPGIGLGARLSTDIDGNTRIISMSAFVNEPA